MSAYSTKTVTRQQAEKLVAECRLKKESIANLSNVELDYELNNYAYSDEYTDILGTLYNYEISQTPKP